MLNLRNRHVLSLRTEFAAAGSWLRSTRMPAGLQSASLWSALSGVMAPKDDPGGGPDS